jgi:prepilin-type N-terminal cleavage/methylation domain-containing protein/prepilin-type processing-associated H-X9-DG protein
MVGGQCVRLRTCRPFVSPLRRGFSLVELLVVIGVIAVLISLLMPAMGRVRESANLTKCLANLHTVGQAAQLHVNEHGGYLPCAGWHWSPIGGVLNPAGLGDEQATKFDYYTDNEVRRPLPVTAALGHYMGVNVRTDSRANLEQDLQGEDLRRHWRCPSQVVEMSGWTQKDSTGWTAPEEVSSYAFNEALLGRRDRTPEQVARGEKWAYPMGQVTAVRRPAEVLLFIDGRTRNQTDRRSFSVFDYGPADTLYEWRQRSDSEVLDAFRHRGRFNVLYVDGHAQTEPMGDEDLKRIGVMKGIYQ